MANVAPEKNKKSTHFSSHGEWDQEERGLNCTVRYFSSKIKFPNNKETLELPIEKNRISF